MEPPELTNFGSLVRFALDLEAATARLYRTAEGLLRGGRGAEVMSVLAEQHESRRKLLERTRQQKLNEMVLEPISGLDGGRYIFETTMTRSSEIRERVLEAEEAAGRFYSESAMAARSLLEAARTFRKLAEENQGNAARIREALPA